MTLQHQAHRNNTNFNKPVGNPRVFLFTDTYAASINRRQNQYETSITGNGRITHQQHESNLTDASGTFNEETRHSAWSRMTAAGAQLMNWFAVACELHRDWRNDVEGLGGILSNHIPNYRNLITSYTKLTEAQKKS